MPVRGYKQTKKTLADGSVKVFYYHRASGTRLPDDPDSHAFKKLLSKLDKEVVDERKAEAERTLKWLVREYMKSPDWTALADTTRDGDGYHIAAIETEFGDMPLAAIEMRGSRGVFLSWRDEIAKRTVRSADAKLAKLARILAFGVDRELLTVNPLATFKRAYKGDRSDIIWLPEHIAAFNAVASPSMRLALALGLHTGQRQGDLRRLTWKQYDGKGISLRQGKTGMDVYVPCTKALKATLDGMDHSTATVLTTARGLVFKKDAFRSAWDRAFVRSGITEGLHFHDLRGTAVTMLAEAGATVPEIASITGHTIESVTKILEKYLSRTRYLAESAIAKLEVRMEGATTDRQPDNSAPKG